MRRRDAIAVVNLLAAGQWGIVTTAQAGHRGVSRVQLARLVDSGLLERVAQGVYVVPTAAADPVTDLRAAWVSLDPARTAEGRIAASRTSVVVSHTSAAALQNLGTLVARQHEVTAAGRRQSNWDGLRIHRGSLTDGEVVLVDGLPVTSSARTVADLLRDRHDLEQVARVAGDALRRRLMTRAELARCLDPLARRFGTESGAGLTHRLDALDAERVGGHG